MRSVAAVVAGYLIFALSAVVLFQITGQAPHRPVTAVFMIGSTVYGIGFAALGGSVAARLAPTRPLLHAGIVAGLIMLGAAVSLLTAARADARWSQVAALVLMAPAAWLGGYQRVRHAAGAA
jgi:hypothetical protein